MKAIEKYFPAVFFMLVESMDEIVKCDHSNESYWMVVSCGTVYAVQGCSNF